MRFLLDMPLSPSLARWLVELGHERAHVADVGMARASDLEILEAAEAEGRAVVTADLDFPRLLALRRLAEPALILFRGGSFSDRWARERLAAVFDVIEEKELETSLVVVERNRIRKRRLPV